jgi:hypothetical protein
MDGYQPQPVRERRSGRRERRRGRDRDPLALMAMMQQFDPERKQQEQLQMQQLRQQIMMQQAAEQRAQEQHVAARERAGRVDPITEQTTQAALDLARGQVGMLPQQQEEAQQKAALARFAFEQAQANAPLEAATRQATLAAQLSIPAHHETMAGIEREKMGLTGRHYDIMEKEQQNQLEAAKQDAALKFILGGGATAAGMPIDQARLGQMTQGALRAPGTMDEFSKLTPEQQLPYLTTHPEVKPMVPPDVSARIFSGTGQPGATGAEGVAGPIDPVERQRKLADIGLAERHLGPSQLYSKIPGVAAYHTGVYGLGRAQNQLVQWAEQLKRMQPTPEQFATQQQAKRKLLMGR